MTQQPSIIRPPVGLVVTLSQSPSASIVGPQTRKISLKYSPSPKTTITDPQLSLSASNDDVTNFLKFVIQQVADNKEDDTPSAICDHPEVLDELERYAKKYDNMKKRRLLLSRTRVDS